MKPTELMIRDWVFKDMNYSEEDPIYTKLDYRPYQITSGEDIDIACETNCIGDADVYQPIPLTPEILEKNGFKLNPQGVYSNGRHTSIGVTRDGRYFANINTETDDPSFLYQCGRYVHEFQHALRLCGLNDLADKLKMEE